MVNAPSMPRSSSPPPLKRARHEQSPSENGSSSPLPPLSLSILGVEPLDEFIKDIADFIYLMISTRPDYPNAKVEVEAKIGLLVNRSTGQRITLPLRVESILSQNAQLNMQFESNMTVAQHKHYNTLLNNLKTTSSQPGYPASPLEYNHKYHIDSFYNSDDKEKIRVTRDAKTSQVVEVVKKIRLGDLNIYSPRRAADWRVSVNLEIPVPHPVGASTHSRKKDRLSYTHEEFVIDLTQVTAQTTRDAPPQILHELEIEIHSSDLLLGTAATRGDPKASEHERSAFDELIRAFVNNARILVRNAGDELPPQ